MPASLAPANAAGIAFLAACRGSFTSALRWPQFDALWAQVRTDAAAGWDLYAVGEPPPRDAADADQVRQFLDALADLLRREHAEAQVPIMPPSSLVMTSVAERG